MDFLTTVFAVISSDNSADIPNKVRQKILADVSGTVEKNEERIADMRGKLESIQTLMNSRIKSLSGGEEEEDELNDASGEVEERGGSASEYNFRLSAADYAREHIQSSMSGAGIPVNAGVSLDATKKGAQTETMIMKRKKQWNSIFEGACNSTSDIENESAFVGLVKKKITNQSVAQNGIRKALKPATVKSKIFLYDALRYGYHKTCLTTAGKSLTILPDDSRSYSQQVAKNAEEKYENLKDDKIKDFVEFLATLLPKTKNPPQTKKKKSLALVGISSLSDDNTWRQDSAFIRAFVNQHDNWKEGRRPSTWEALIFLKSLSNGGQA